MRTANAPFASAGTSTVALVPSAEADVGRTRRTYAVPLLSTERTIRSLDVDRPVPVTVIACPAFADAFVASAAVPDSATPVIPEIPAVNEALDPPAVFTTIGPNAPSLSGTVRYTTDP